MSFKENGVGGLVSQGIGTSMLQMPNILKKPRVWLPPIIASAITGPIATCVFKLQMNGPAVSSGMGTCGLVGQIGVYTGWVADVASGAKAGITAFDWAGLLLVSFVLPAVLCAVLGVLFRKKLDQGRRPEAGLSQWTFRKCGCCCNSTRASNFIPQNACRFVYHPWRRPCKRL
mgnify:CR=1 FL=1